MPKSPNYEKTIEATEEAVKKFREYNDWKLHKQVNDTNKIYYRSSPNFSGTLYKVVCEFPVDHMTLFNLIAPNPETPEGPICDKAITGQDFLLEIVPELWLVRTYTAPVAGGLISAREFLDVIAIRRSDSLCCLLYQSIQAADYPPKKGLVRGWNYPAGDFITPITSKSSRVESYLEMSAGGLIPQRITDTVIPDEKIKWMAEIEKHIQPK